MTDRYHEGNRRLQDRFDTRLRADRRRAHARVPDEAHPLLAAFTDAQLVVRVRATDVLPNCPRYVHRMEHVERSRLVPHEECETPIPDWKRREWSHDVLPEGDPARGEELLPG
jgi:hypothetical protein